MRMPNVFTSLDIKKWDIATDAIIDGKKAYVPVRPLGFVGLFLFSRIGIAWNVFTGKWDALRWPHND